jgi:hypothetical protein
VIWWVGQLPWTDGPIGDSVGQAPPTARNGPRSVGGFFLAGEVQGVGCLFADARSRMHCSDR